MGLEEVRTMEFVLVPAGSFPMGEDYEVDLDPYEIGRYPVTVAQFAAFIEATGYDGNPEATRDAAERGHHPVTRVSWEGAVAFCAWASDVTGRQVRLPTEAEWEKAARGTDGRKYPWGNEEPDDSRCNFNGKDTTPVGTYSPKGDSPYGAADMAGNVWEWCADWFDEDYYNRAPNENPTGPATGTLRVVRGGSWHFEGVQAYRRHRCTPYLRFEHNGFRCVRSQ